LGLGQAQTPHLKQRIRQSFQSAHRALGVGRRLRLRAERRPHDFHRRQFLLYCSLQAVGHGWRVSLPRRGRVAGEAGRVGALTDTYLSLGPNRLLGLLQQTQVRRQIARRAILPQCPSLVMGKPVQRLAVNAQIRSNRSLRLVAVLIAAARICDGRRRETAMLTTVVHVGTGGLMEL
jgi:hypothetical protein